jgi:hypothetical protein
MRLHVVGVLFIGNTNPGGIGGRFVGFRLRFGYVQFLLPVFLLFCVAVTSLSSFSL